MPGNRTGHLCSYPLPPDSDMSELQLSFNRLLHALVHLGRPDFSHCMYGSNMQIIVEVKHEAKAAGADEKELGPSWHYNLICCKLFQSVKLSDRLKLDSRAVSAVTHLYCFKINKMTLMTLLVPFHKKQNKAKLVSDIILRMNKKRKEKMELLKLRVQRVHRTDCTARFSSFYRCLTGFSSGLVGNHFSVVHCLVFFFATVGAFHCVSGPVSEPMTCSRTFCFRELSPKSIVVCQ